MGDFDFFDPGMFDLGFDPSLTFPDFDFSFPDFSIPDFDFSFDFDFPTFDPGQFDLGFDPNFDIGTFSPSLSDPFAIPTGDLSLPNFDLSGFLANDTQFSLGDFNPSLNGLGNFNFTPTSFGEVPELSPDLQSLSLGPSLAGFGGTAPGTSPDLLNIQEGIGMDTPRLNLNPSFNMAKVDLSGGGAGGAAPSGNDALKDAQAGYYKYAPLLGLGQLGLGLGGALMGAFGGQAKPRGPSDIEKAKIQADIDNAKARLDLEREQMELQAEIAREKMGMEAGTAEQLARKPLFTTDPRFSALYDQTTAAQRGLSPGNPEIQAMTQQIYGVRMQAAQAEYARQREGILERANRLGTNPAAELAQLAEAEQKAKDALFVEAQQAALAFAQSRLEPATQLLDAILKTVV